VACYSVNFTITVT